MTFPTCSTCVHWEPLPELEFNYSGLPEPTRWGTCNRITDYTTTTVPPETLAVTQDNEDYQSWLRTRDVFGCVLHEAKP